MCQNECRPEQTVRHHQHQPELTLCLTHITLFTAAGSTAGRPARSTAAETETYLRNLHADVSVQFDLDCIVKSTRYKTVTRYFCNLQFIYSLLQVTCII